MRSIQETLPWEDAALKIRCFTLRGRLGVPSYCHWHNEVEIVYSRTGSGIQQVHETSYVLAPGALAVIGQNQLHAYTPCDTEADLLVLQFDAAAFLNGSQAGGRMGEAWLAGRLFFDAPVPSGPEMGRLLERIHAELKGRPDGYQTAVTADVLRLLVDLYRTDRGRLSTVSLANPSDRQRDMLAKAFELINEQYDREGLTLAQAAGAVHLSVSHFCRLFKQATGMTFHRYLNHYRIVQARQMLDTGRTLSEAAFACGFGSLSAFHRSYKKYGTSSDI